MLSFFIYFLTAVLVLVCILTVLIVLMQRPKQEGLGAAFGAGVTDQMWGAQTTNVLQRGTVYLAVLFFGITLVLAVLVNAQQKEQRDTLKGLSESPATPSAPATPPGLGDPTPELGTTPSFDDIKVNPDSPTPAPLTGNLPEPVTEAPKPDAGSETPEPETTEESSEETTEEATDTTAEVEKLLEEISTDPVGAAVEAAVESAAPEAPKSE